jgi:cellulose synthase/poly-beta-1,6-N-acetylglucosamine synthase-like glycosyltransferase
MKNAIGSSLMTEKKAEKLPVSAVMVIYNEEKVLERALRSFCDLVDETIIVHDGKCSDKSLEIARKYTNRIFEREHIGASERHRPFTYSPLKTKYDFSGILSPWSKQTLQPKKKPCLKTT